MTTPPATIAPPSRGARPPTGRREGVGRLAAMLLSPTFIVIALVVGYPVLSSFRLALYQKNEGVDPDTGFVQKGDRFVGLDNFTGMLSNEKFLGAFWNTTTFTIVSVIVETVIGVLMALVMHRAFRGRAFIRASILIPWAIPTAITGLLWRWIFQVDGIGNTVLGRTNADGVQGTDDDKIRWTAEDSWMTLPDFLSGGPLDSMVTYSWLAVVIADTWKTAPFIGLLVLAGLQIIPAEVYEAAKVDGANPWQSFWRITLPLVKPALLVAVLFRLLDVLRMFDLPFTLIGPNKGSVETLSMLSYVQAAQFNNYGPAAAYAIALFVYISLAAFVFVKLLGADVIGTRAGRK